MHLECIQPPKRKRESFAPVVGRRRPSLKRQRVEEGIVPRDSRSTVFSSHPLDLGQHNTFSPPGSYVESRGASRAGTGASSPRRGINPSRETIATLNDALPPIQTEPFDDAQLPADRAIRDKVMATMEQLELGQVDGWVPRCLQVRAHICSTYPTTELSPSPQEAMISDNLHSLQNWMAP
jgi:hypothetical protein